MRQDGCTCGNNPSPTHLVGCPVRPMRRMTDDISPEMLLGRRPMPTVDDDGDGYGGRELNRAEVEAALRDRINEHVTAVAKWALREYRDQLRDQITALPDRSGLADASLSRDAVLALLDR